MFYRCTLKCRLPKILANYIASCLERGMLKHFLDKMSFEVKYHSVFKSFAFVILLQLQVVYE